MHGESDLPYPGVKFQSTGLSSQDISELNPFVLTPGYLQSKSLRAPGFLNNYPHVFLWSHVLTYPEGLFLSAEQTENVLVDKRYLEIGL